MLIHIKGVYRHAKAMGACSQNKANLKITDPDDVNTLMNNQISGYACSTYKHSLKSLICHWPVGLLAFLV